jgi:uncharacterized lipoprotein YmbA
MKRSVVLAVAMGAICLTALGLGGCGGVTPPVKYYTLNALSRTEAPAAAAQALTLSVAVAGIPGILDRPQIVTRTAENRVNISEFHRWAVSLKEDLTRVLVENLNVLLAGERIRARTTETAFDPAYQLIVHISQLEGGLGATVTLKAVWTIRDVRAKAVILSDEVLIEQPVEAESYEAFVAGQSRAVGVLSQEIATKFRDLLKPLK